MTKPLWLHYKYLHEYNVSLDNDNLVAMCFVFRFRT